jgi:hypothetical protein
LALGTKHVLPVAWIIREDCGNVNIQLAISNFEMRIAKTHISIPGHQKISRRNIKTAEHQVQIGNFESGTLVYWCSAR